MLGVEVHVRDDLGAVLGAAGHLPGIAQVRDAGLDHHGEGLEEVVVDEGLLADFAVLAVVLALRARHAQILEHEAEDVGEETIAVVRGVGLAHVLHHARVDRGHAAGADGILDADGVVRTA